MVLIQKEREGATPAEYVAANLTPTLTQGLMALCQARPKDPVTFLGEWLLAHKAETSAVLPHGTIDALKIRDVFMQFDSDGDGALTMGERA